MTNIFLYVESECPLCLDNPKTDALECHPTHQLCHECAKQIFDKMREEKKESIPCFICRKEVSSYSKIQTQQKKIEHLQKNQSWTIGCIPYLSFFTACQSGRLIKLKHQ